MIVEKHLFCEYTNKLYDCICYIRMLCIFCLMFMLFFQVVLFPVTVGLVLNTYAKGVVNVIQPIMPFVAMICTSLCIGSPLAINRRQILSSEGLSLLLPILKDCIP